MEFLDLNDGVEALNVNYWTALTRSGCVGNIKNCFSNGTDLVASYAHYDSYFWRMFDTTTKGACVALQTLPYGMHQTFADKDVTRFPTGPIFVKCNDLNYVACEAKGPRSQLINQHELKVNFIIKKNQIQT